MSDRDFNAPADSREIPGDDFYIDGVRCREIPEHPGNAVSDTGRVFTQWWKRVCRSNEWRERKLSICRGRRRSGIDYVPYAFIAIGIKGSRIQTGVHRLVLLAFIGPCPPGMECRHLDGNPTNNVLKNLEWGTPKQNTADKDAHGRVPRGTRNPKSKLTDQQVAEIVAAIKSDEPYPSIAKRYGVFKTTILGIAQFKSRKAETGEKLARGRRFGERSTHAKLTEKQVIEIRRAFAAGVSQSDLGEIYGVNGGTIYCVVKRRTWKHVA